MTYEIFKKELKNALSKKFGEGTITISTTLFNGKETETFKLSIDNHDTFCPIKPLFCLYERDKQPIEYFVSMLEIALDKMENGHLIHPSRVLYRLVNRKDAAEYLSHVPHLPFYDMAITFMYQLDDDMQNRKYRFITNNIMKENNLTVSKLMDLAHENTQRMYPCQTNLLVAHILESMYFDPTCNINEFIQFAITSFDERSHIKAPMYIISSSDYRYGGSALAYPEYLEMLANRFGTSLIVIPDDDKAFFVIPYFDGIDIAGIKETLSTKEFKSLNRISEHIFFYDKDKKSLTIAEEDV